MNSLTFFILLLAFDICVAWAPCIKFLLNWSIWHCTFGFWRHCCCLKVPASSSLFLFYFWLLMVVLFKCSASTSFFLLLHENFCKLLCRPLMLLPLLVCQGFTSVILILSVFKPFAEFCFMFWLSIAFCICSSLLSFQLSITFCKCFCFLVSASNFVFILLCC
jgi:hypothetical protein